jgi:hypothetical protein
MSPTGTVHLDKKLQAHTTVQTHPSHSRQEKMSTPSLRHGKIAMSPAENEKCFQILFNLHVEWRLGKTRVIAESFSWSNSM